MGRSEHNSIAAALGAIPSGLFVLTAQHEDRRGGILAGWVQQVCFQPPMVCVAIAKGRPIMPLISESRQFGLCQLADDDKVIRRKFNDIDESDDPFLGFELVHSHLPHLPILAGALAHLECELVSHLDVEGDHDLFVGRVHAGQRHDGKPYVHVRDDGFKY